MNQRRKKLLFALFVTAPATALAVACTFPDVTFNEGGGSGLDSSPEGATSSSGDAGIDARDTGSPFLEDGGLADVVSRDEDAAKIPDAAGCDARCDCDDDGYLKTGCDAAAPGDTKPVIGVDDCDDLDDLVHPGQTFSDALPRQGSPNPGDWDCDGEVTKGYKEDFQCVGLATLCTDNGKNGKFTKAVPCGTAGELYDCVKGLGCEQTLHAVMRQLCK